MAVQIRGKILVYVFGVLAALFTVLVISAFLLLRDHQDTLKQNAYDETGIAAMQLRLHYEIMMGALNKVEHNVPGSSLDDAVIQFDIFYERLKSLPTRPTYDQLLDDETRVVQAGALNVLNRVLPRIDRAADGDATALKGLFTELSALRNSIERLGHKPVQVASERRAAVTAQFKKIADLFVWVIAGFISTGAIFAAIIWRQLSHAKERQRELEELTHSLEAARDVAEAASKAKSDFLAHMSHELRTPMNSILGFAQLLEIQKLDQKQTQAVNQILRSGSLLMHLIDQVLELNKIISGHISVSVQKFSPADTITTCLGMMEAMASERSITLGALPSMHQVPDIESDPNRLQQVLLNLMSNAIKYNHDGGEVTLGCEVLSGEKGWVRFTVTDTGEGLPEGSEDDLFQPFNRLGRETMNIEGTGIGLTITRELARVLNGRIGYVSALGKGSTFWIDLPVHGEETLVYDN